MNSKKETAVPESPADKPITLADAKELAEVFARELRGESRAEQLNASALSAWQEAEAARPLAREAYLFYRRRDTRSVSVDRFQRMSDGVYKRCEPRPGYPRNHPDEVRKIEDEVFSSANPAEVRAMRSENPSERLNYQASKLEKTREALQRKAGMVVYDRLTRSVLNGSLFVEGILSESDHAQWLRPGEEPDPETLARLLAPSEPAAPGAAPNHAAPPADAVAAPERETHGAQRAAQHSAPPSEVIARPEGTRGELDALRDSSDAGKVGLG